MAAKWSHMHERHLSFTEASKDKFTRHDKWSNLKLRSSQIWLNQTSAYKFFIEKLKQYRKNIYQKALNLERGGNFRYFRNILYGQLNLDIDSII